MYRSFIAGYASAREKFHHLSETAAWLVLSYLAWALVVRPTVVWFRKWSALRQLPGPSDRIPFWYSIRTYWEKSRSNSVKDATCVFFQLICDVCRQYRGTTFKAYLGMTPVVVLHTPDAVQTLLTSKTNLRKPVVYNFLATWLGEHSTLTSVGDMWRFKRRLLTPAFHFKVLDSYISAFNYNATLLVERVDRLNAKHPNEPIPAFRLSQNCALDVITKVCMGVDLGSQLDTTEPIFANHFNMLMFLIGVRIFRPWMWPDFWYARTSEGRLYYKSIREMEKYTLEVLERRKGKLQQIAKEMESMPGDCGEGDDQVQDSVVVDRFLRTHLRDSRYSIYDVKKDIDSLLFAGTDTTTSAVGWAFYMLGLHPKVLAKVHEELDDIFCGDNERDITGEDLKRLKYLDICFKESLRLFPSVPIIGRVLDEEMEVDGYKIPKGVTCFVNIYSLHRNPEYFKDPELFIPERFLTPEVRNRHPFSYIPFSGGPKNCLGQRFALMEAKTIMAKLLRKYTLESTRPVSELRITYEVILKARGGLRIFFRNRSHVERAAKLADFEDRETNYGL
ncbi:cytochrome P450 4V2 isoform X2 [Rhipicephalus sanguineus]|uniref:cytochrome P450 4V2 isoform X2 n=1 Tax=Rhipicephalus sanguineus TaxID=34632 RepID=UPI001895869E|nr:cytochrome P450 4V2 isoform X2 [Rhipicephalus sanguineus]